MCYFLRFEEMHDKKTEEIMNIREASNWKLDLVLANIKKLTLHCWRICEKNEKLKHTCSPKTREKKPIHSRELK
jgi:hypothetical protein